MVEIEITEGTSYYPSAVAFEVTLACNMKCIHCGSRAPVARPNELTLEEWKGAVNELKQLKSDVIFLSGGEPFVWRPWRELIEYIKDSGIQFSIITNGYSLSREDARFLGNLKMSSIGFSVDGMAETHNKIRAVSDSFERVTRSIDFCNEAGVKTIAVTSVNNFNIGDLDRLREYLEAHNVALWQVQIVNSFGRAGDMRDELIISRDKYASLIEYIHCAQNDGNGKMKVMPSDSIGYCYGKSADVWGDLEWQGCNAGRYVMGIRSNGDVSGCLSLQNGRFIVGNIRKKRLTELWSDDEAFACNRGFSKEDVTGVCKGCEYVDRCRGGCRAMGYSITNEICNNPYCFYAIETQR